MHATRLSLTRLGHLTRLVVYPRLAARAYSPWNKESLGHYGTHALALDVGGTFTDVMLMHRESGQLWIVKTPSTPTDASEGFFQGIQKILSLAGVAPAAVGHVLRLNGGDEHHSGRQGASTGMITTEGFKYVLEIGRHDIPGAPICTPG